MQFFFSCFLGSFSPAFVFGGPFPFRLLVVTFSIRDFLINPRSPTLLSPGPPHSIWTHNNPTLSHFLLLPFFCGCSFLVFFFCDETSLFLLPSISCAPDLSLSLSPRWVTHFLFCPFHQPALFLNTAPDQNGSQDPETPAALSQAAPPFTTVPVPTPTARHEPILNTEFSFRVRSPPSH